MFLCSSPGRIPKTQDAWATRLSHEDARERQKAIRRLTWDGAEYKLIYQWQTYQGDKIWIEEHARRKSGAGDKATEIDGVMRNVTVRKNGRKIARPIWPIMMTLTGVANPRLACKRTVDQLAALTQRQRSEGALLRLRLAILKISMTCTGLKPGIKSSWNLENVLSRIVRRPDVVGPYR